MSLFATHLCATTWNVAARTTHPARLFRQTAFKTLCHRMVSTETNVKEEPEHAHHFKDTAQAVIADHNRHTKQEGKHEEDWVLFHPVYTREELANVKVSHRSPKGLSDRVALAAVHLLRFVFDKATGYKHDTHFAEAPDALTNAMDDAHAVQMEKQGRPVTKSASEQILKKEKDLKTATGMSVNQWLNRIVFLESIAGVPGMVGAMARHMRSLRLLRRDHGWIHTLLEEAENERMHLLTFLSLRKPGPIFRGAVLMGQGIFFNAFFLAYLIHPKTCHRFVGFLEEEAVITYTRCLNDLNAGKLPEWGQLEAPEIAVKYWRLAGEATMKDVILAVRADEANHRHVNHTLADLTGEARNPFARQNGKAGH